MTTRTSRSSSRRRPRAERERLHRARASATQATACTGRSSAAWCFDELRTNAGGPLGGADRVRHRRPADPAVGGMARLLGVVDRPDARRINKRPIPRLGGLAIFLGILVPVSRVSRPLRREPRRAAGRCGRVGRRRGRRLPRPRSADRKLAGQVVAASIPCAFGVWIDHFTLPFLGVLDLPAWIGMPLSVVLSWP